MKAEYVYTTLMPSGAWIVSYGSEGVRIRYPDGTKRWISNDFFSDEYITDLCKPEPVYRHTVTLPIGNDKDYYAMMETILSAPYIWI
jgi:hypothetical protein